MERFCGGEELKMPFVFKSAFVFLSGNAFGDCFIKVVCHMRAEHFALKRMVHSKLT